VTSRTTSPAKRTVALCYVRQSYTRNPSDMDSPERQRDNIERVCQNKGWTPEWFVDAEGHKSGTKTHNRPGWLALEQRLKDPDVVAVVANDLARLHRKGWRIGQLVDLLEQHGIYLVLTAPGRELDLSKPQDRIAIQIIAMIDEWYAIDARLRLNDSVRYRHRHGITIGIPPFGTVRNEDGLLVPSPYGAWLMPNGMAIPGRLGDEKPDAEAVWHGYYDCAVRMFTLFAKNNFGKQSIAVMMNEEGWSFRERNGQPRPITKEDIRRVIANWREYAGLTPGGRVQDKTAAYLSDPLAELTETGRNVIDMELIRAAALVQHKRSMAVSKRSYKREFHHYALSGILYCAHCAQDARDTGNLKLHSKLTGHKQDRRVLRYRHATGHVCRATNRSIMRDSVEAEFYRLLQLLTVNPDKLPLLNQLYTLSRGEGTQGDETSRLEDEKRSAIAKCRKRIDNARALCLAGDLSAEEFATIKEQNEREISHWQARTSELEQAALGLALCVETTNRMATMWEVSSGEDKQGMVRMLFEYVEYDLDTQRITGFRLKPWAEDFLILREALYETEEGTEFKEMTGEIGSENGSEFDATCLLPEGLEPPTPGSEDLRSDH
jgi:DNA invertase Pin-like site-specific DNA recombinase